MKWNFNGTFIKKEKMPVIIKMIFITYLSSYMEGPLKTTHPLSPGVLTMYAFTCDSYCVCFKLTTFMAVEQRGVSM